MPKGTSKVERWVLTMPQEKFSSMEPIRDYAVNIVHHTAKAPFEAFIMMQPSIDDIRF